MTAFDHREHCRDLERAEKELLHIGKHALAAAVCKARMIHVDMEGRIANAKREAAAVRRLANKLEETANSLETYTLNPQAPWLSPPEELFPRGG